MIQLSETEHGSLKLLKLEMLNCIKLISAKFKFVIYWSSKFIFDFYVLNAEMCFYNGQTWLVEKYSNFLLSDYCTCTLKYMLLLWTQQKYCFHISLFSDYLFYHLDIKCEEYITSDCLYDSPTQITFGIVVHFPVNDFLLRPYSLRTETQLLCYFLNMKWVYDICTRRS